MALYYDLPVYRDVYSLILKIFEYTKDFPREYKYTLGQDLKRDSLVLVRSIYRANKAKSDLLLSRNNSRSAFFSVR
ncbi:MAG: four helix bundle protein [Chlorobium sp.]